MRLLPVAGLVVLWTLAACSASSPTFTADDEAAVRALEEAYRSGWLANESEAVMSTLASDAVLMPAGVQPLIGEPAIRDYWWPADGSLTTIDAYRIEVDELAGSGDLAYLRGRGELEFTYRDANGDVSQLSSRAVHLSVAQRGEDGSWRIIRHRTGQVGPGSGRVGPMRYHGARG